MPFPAHIRFSEFQYEREIEWGDVYWFDFGEVRGGQERTMAGPHPALVVSNPAVTLKGVVLIMPISSIEHRKQDYRFHVPLGKDECRGLDNDSFVQADRIYSVTVQNNLPDQFYVGHLDYQVMRRIFNQLMLVLNFDGLRKALSTS